MNIKLLTASIMVCVLFVGCNESSSSDDTTDSSSTTKAVLCGLVSSGKQNLVYDNFDPMTSTHNAINDILDYSYNWSCSDTERKLTGNGVPNHAVTGGEFATKISAQNVSATFTLTPALTTASTNVKEPGYALNSVKFDPATAGTCPDTATTGTHCNYAGGSGNWRMVALPGNTSPWKFSFGVDTSNGHVQPGGIYHYHGVPTELLPKLNAVSTTTMTLVGWAVDGFPIYARYGYSDPNNAQSSLVTMKSSYKTISTPSTNRPSIAYFPLGHFESDWEYVAGSGDLDECNGQFGVTPEFPNGIYHYYMTDTYPYIQRCVKGTAAITSTGFSSGGFPPPPPPPQTTL